MLRHADIYRVQGHGLNLNGFPKNIPAMQWLIDRLDSFYKPVAGVPGGKPPCISLPAIVRTTRCLAAVVDTFMYYCKVQDSRGMLSCARIHAAIDRENEYPHLNVLYNLMTGTFLKEFDRFPCPETERRQLHE